MIRFTIITIESFLITLALFTWSALETPSKISIAGGLIGLWWITAFWWGNTWATKQIGKLFAKFDRPQSRTA